MRKVLNWVWSFVEVIIIIYVILVTMFVLCKNKYGYTQFGDYSFANIDLIAEKNVKDTKKGDLLVVKNSNDIHKGDLIYYYAVFNDNYIVRSAVVTDVKEDDFSALYTVALSNTTINVASTRVLGKYSTIYHNLGSILSILESRVGFLLLVLLPIMIVFIYQVYEFVIMLKYDETLVNGDNTSKRSRVSKILQKNKKEEVKKSVLEEKKEKEEKEPEVKEENTSKKETEEDIEIL